MGFHLFDANSDPARKSSTGLARFETGCADYPTM